MHLKLNYILIRFNCTKCNDLCHMYFNILYLVSLCSYDTLKSYMYKYSSSVAQYTPARIKMIIYVSIHFRENYAIMYFRGSPR